MKSIELTHIFYKLLHMLDIMQEFMMNGSIHGKGICSYYNLVTLLLRSCYNPVVCVRVTYLSHE